MSETKILFVGDIHGKKSSPLDRLCDYNEDLYAKLSWIVNYANEHNVQNIIHLGDMTDKPEMPEEVKNRFIQIFRKYNGTFWSIIGMAHDLFYNDETSYSKTCLYNLELAGVVKIIREPILIGDVEIFPLDMRAKKAKEQILSIDSHFKISYEHIILGHQFYEWDLDKSAGITLEELLQVKTKCDLILGHDHRQHETIQADQVTVWRPGSLMRTELSETTISMHPRILLYDNHLWSYIEVPHRPIDEIYNVAAYRNNKANSKAFRQLKNNLEDISRYFHENDDVMLCSEGLKKVNCPPEEYEYLKAVHQTCGREF